MEVSHKNLMFGSRAIAQEKRKQLESDLIKLTESINYLYNDTDISYLSNVQNEVDNLLVKIKNLKI